MSGPSFTHIINPFRTAVESEHDVAQRVTFASLQLAIDEAKKDALDVEVLGCAYKEDAPAVRSPAVAALTLSRSVQDVGCFQTPKRFPLIVDLFGVAAELGRGEYVIYTNMDIALQPCFYRVVARVIEDSDRANQALIVNRRQIGTEFTDPRDLAKMFVQKGKRHPGFDCFIFPRSWIPKLQLGRLCIGVPLFDETLVANLDAISGYRVRILFDQFLTFHLGEDRQWRKWVDLAKHNQTEAIAAMASLAAQYGPPTRTSLFSVMNAVISGKPIPRRTLISRIARRVMRTITEQRYVRLSNALKAEWMAEHATGLAIWGFALACTLVL